LGAGRRPRGKYKIPFLISSINKKFIHLNKYIYELSSYL